MKLVWNHTALAKSARTISGAPRAPHQLSFYEVNVNRTRCLETPAGRACSSSEFKCIIASAVYPVTSDLFHSPVGAECTGQSTACDSESCSYEVRGITSGQEVSVSVHAVNRGGEGQAARDSVRWMFLPASNLKLIEREVGAAGLQVQLEWQAPADTGYGDTLSLPIDMYRLEIASCVSFSAAYPCLYFLDEVYANNSNLTHLGNHSGDGFGYPLTYDVPVDLHHGFFYSYRVQALNALGFPVAPQVLRFQYGTIPFATASITVHPTP
jgi:hypothetical protein